ncbi:hypothetical protein H257_19467, partial [Aphanomyces astaci]
VPKVSHGSMSIVAEEAKAIAAAAAKAAEAATKAASGGVAETPAGDGGKQGKTSAKGAAVKDGGESERRRWRTGAGRPRSR